jgi:hypothetical protein
MRSSVELSVVITSSLASADVLSFLFQHITRLPQKKQDVLVLPFEKHAVIVAGKDKWPQLRFRSSPLKPPKFEVPQKPKESDQPYIFTTPRGPFRESGKPVIFTADGDLVFVDPSHSHAADFKVQPYNDGPALTLWDGWSTGSPCPGHGYGKSILFDLSYRHTELDLDVDINALVDYPPGHKDLHDHQMTDRVTLLVSAYNNTRWDLSAVGGSEDGLLTSSMIFEIPIDNKEELYSWEAAKHISLNESRLTVDSYMGDGTVDASMGLLPHQLHPRARRDSPAYQQQAYVEQLCNQKIHRGTFIQKIDSHELSFSWASHARAHDLRDDGTFDMTLFDNYNMKEDKFGNVTRGMLMGVTPNHAEVLQSFDTDFYADSQGSFQQLDNGKLFMGVRRITAFIEFDANGDIVYEACFASGETG